MPQDPAEQPTLSDGTVTLRAWREDDVAVAVAGHDERIRYWFGQAAAPTYDEQREVVARWRREYAAGTRFNFVVDVDGTAVGAVELRRPDPAAADPGAGDPHTGDLSWWLFSGQRGHGWATRAVRVLADWALTEAGQGGLGLAGSRPASSPATSRPCGSPPAPACAARGCAGCSPAPGTAPRPASTSCSPGSATTRRSASRRRSARCSTRSCPASARSARCWCATRPAGCCCASSPTSRTGTCRVAWSRSASRRSWRARARSRRSSACACPAGPLLLTDWLPPWGGWDDALCLVFDGGTHPAEITRGFVKQAREIRDAEFCTPGRSASAAPTSPRGGSRPPCGASTAGRGGARLHGVRTLRTCSPSH